MNPSPTPPTSPSLSSPSSPPLSSSPTTPDPILSPTPNTSQNSSRRRRVATILGLTLLILVALIYIFATPYQIAGNPVPPYRTDQYILSERVSLLFNAPTLGETVIFTSEPLSPSIGVITAENSNSRYTIYTGPGRSWQVDRQDIYGRVYYPRFDATLLVTNANPPTATPTPSPSPTPAPFKTYGNARYGYTLEYPSSWELGVNKFPEKETAKTQEVLEYIRFFEKAPGHGEFALRVFSNPQQQTINSWAKSFRVNSPMGTNLASPSGELTVAGQLAPTFSVFSYDSYETVIGLIHAGHLLTFTYTTSDGVLEETEIAADIPAYEQILRSVILFPPEDTEITKPEP